MELTTATWAVELKLSERDGMTYAEARLHTGLSAPLIGVGTARLYPYDHLDVAEVGYELAAARALTQLGEVLLATARLDVDALNAP